MKLKKELLLKRNNNEIKIKRTPNGIPEIFANNIVDAAFATGFVHANDRQMQMFLTRVLLKGKASEKLSDEKGLVEIDKFIRRMNFFPSIDKEVERLEPIVKKQLVAYTEGVNYYMQNNKGIFDFKLLGYKPEKWDLKDSLLISKVFGFIGLVDAQMAMEKLIVQMIQNDIEEDKIKELFPYISEKIDYDLIKKVTVENPLTPDALKWFDKLPRFNASNNWVVSGKLTESGLPILCGDPHLEGNRLPNIWAELIINIPDNRITGVTVPGSVGVILGRNKNVAWTATYTFMDMLDYKIEHCKNGKYKRENGEYHDFKIRKEIIKTKKNRLIEEVFYENENGTLEGNPQKEGYYLAFKWSAQDDCGAGDYNGLLRMHEAKTVKEAQKLLSMPDASTFNFVIADTEGNIGYQMSGRMFKRAEGVSGLIPLPAWESKYNYQGYEVKANLPTLYNPDENMIVTANQDLNKWGVANPINLAMASYRADRITELLKIKKKININDMKKIHYDLFSIQARKLMQYIAPLLPDSANAEILKKWDLNYDHNSKGATIFENIYINILKVVFGENGFGVSVVEHLMKETSMFNDYYGNFDNILFKENSVWYKNTSREELFKKGIEAGLKEIVLPYGETRKVLLANLLFGRKLPKFLGFDYGPISLPGNRATIPQGQIFNSGGRITTFTPSYRFVTDMVINKMHTNMLGGVSDRRFSKLYTNDIKNWFEGNYKTL